MFKSNRNLHQKRQILQSGHQRAKSSTLIGPPQGFQVTQNPERLYGKILRPPSASHLRGYQAVKQENPAYFTANKPSQLFSHHSKTSSFCQFMTSKEAASTAIPTQKQSSTNAQNSRMSSARFRNEDYDQNLYQQARQQRQSQASWTHSSVAQSLRFQDLQVAAQKMKPQNHPSNCHRRKLSKQDSKKVAASTQSQESTTQLLASQMDVMDVYHGIGQSRHNESAFGSQGSTRIFSSSNYGQFSRKGNNLAGQDFLVVPTATMATSSAEIKRFAELADKQRQVAMAQLQGIRGTKSNLISGTRGSSAQQERFAGHQKFGSQAQQDFDFYKKALGIDSQKRPSYLETKIEASNNQKQILEQGKQSQPQQSYVGDVRIKKAEITLQIAAQKQQSQISASGDAKTPIRTALLRETEDFARLTSLGSLVGPAGFANDGLKSIDNAINSADEVSSAHGNTFFGVQDANDKEVASQAALDQALLNNSTNQIYQPPRNSERMPLLQSQPKHAILVKQRNQSSQNMVQLSKGLPTEAADWPSQQTVLMRGDEDQAAMLRPTESFPPEELSKLSQSARFANQIPSNRESIDQKSQVKLGNDNTSGQGQQDSNLKEVDSKIASNLTRLNTMQQSEKNKVIKGLRNLVQTSRPDQATRKTSLRELDKVRLKKDNSFNAIQEEQMRHQSLSIQDLNPIHQLQELSEVSSSLDSKVEASKENVLSSHEIKNYKDSDMALTQVQMDIRQNAQIRGNTPNRHAPQNVYRNSASPILSFQNLHRHTVAEARNSFQVKLKSGDSVTGHSQRIDMAFYGYSDQGYAQASANPTPTLGKAQINTFSPDTQAKQSKVQTARRSEKENQENCTDNESSRDQVLFKLVDQKCDPTQNSVTIDKSDQQVEQSSQETKPAYKDTAESKKFESSLSLNQLPAAIQIDSQSQTVIRPHSNKQVNKSDDEASKLADQQNGKVHQRHQSFSNLRIRNKFVANKDMELQSYPTHLEKIAQMSEFYSNDRCSKKHKRPKSVATGGNHINQNKSSEQQNLSMQATERKIAEYLRQEVEFATYLRKQMQEKSVPSSKRDQLDTEDEQEINFGEYVTKTHQTRTPFLGQQPPGLQSNLQTETPGFNKATPETDYEPLVQRPQLKLDTEEERNLAESEKDDFVIDHLGQGEDSLDYFEQHIWKPKREAVFHRPESDLLRRAAKFQQYLDDNNLTNEQHVSRYEQLAMKRVGQLPKPLGFTLAKELRSITQHNHKFKLDKLSYEGVSNKFTEFLHVHHQDEYQMRAKDLLELQNEYDPSTEEGRQRIKDFEALKEKVMKPFAQRQKELLLTTHNLGHITQPIQEYVEARKSTLMNDTFDSLQSSRLGLNSLSPTRERVVTSAIKDEMDDIQTTIQPTIEDQENFKKDPNKTSCTLEKIMEGYYLEAFAKLTQQLDLYLPTAGSKASNQRERETLTKSAFECVNKVVNHRQPIEQNLILSILFKAFKQIDQRIAKRFKILANLTTKITTETFTKGQIIQYPEHSLKAVYIVYSGQVEQRFMMGPPRENQLLLAEDIIGLWNIKERQYHRSCGIKATVLSEKAEVFKIELNDVDQALDKCEKMQLSNFVAIVRFYMARDPISLASFTNKDGQLKLDFAMQHQQDGSLSRNMNQSLSGSAIVTKSNAQITASFSQPLQSIQESKQGTQEVKQEGSRRQNKLIRINSIYEHHFKLIPFFTRDMLHLVSKLVIKTYEPGQVVFDFDTVPTSFFVIKQGRIRFEDQRLQSSQNKAKGSDKRKPKGGQRDTSLIKVEGEWFGFESFICGPYATMTQDELLKKSMAGHTGVGNGFRATALERVEVVSGSLDTLFSTLTMEDIRSLHLRFVNSLYRNHSAYNLLVARNQV